MLYTLKNGVPTPCPTDHNGMGNLRDDYWRGHGGKPLVPADRPAGNYAAGYVETADRIQEVWTPVAPAPVALSKWKLRKAFKGLGKGQQFEQYLASSEDIADEWADATVLMSDNPLVLHAAAAFKSSLGLTDRQVEELVAACQA